MCLKSFFAKILGMLTMWGELDLFTHLCPHSHLNLVYARWNLTGISHQSEILRSLIFVMINNSHQNRITKAKRTDYPCYVALLDPKILRDNMFISNHFCTICSTTENNGFRRRTRKGFPRRVLVHRSRFGQQGSQQHQWPFGCK